MNETFMGIPINRFADADSFVGKLLRAGVRRNNRDPSQGLPEIVGEPVMDMPTSKDLI